MTELEYQIIETALLAHARSLVVRLGDDLDAETRELVEVEYRKTHQLISRAEHRCLVLALTMEDLGLTV